MGRARTICYRRKQLACSNRVPIVARRSKCGAGGPSASTLAGERWLVRDHVSGDELTALTTTDEVEQRVVIPLHG